MVVIEKIEGIDEEIIEQMRVQLENLINDSFANNLNLTRLDCLYFPSDFDKAVLDFQITQEIEEQGFTDNEMGTAFGKTIPLKVDGVDKDRIFIRKEILIALFDDNAEKEFKQLSLNLIHHELCHVHENYDLASMVKFQKELDEEKESLNHVLNLHAMNIFSEYIVPKMAVTTKSPNKILDAEHLKKILKFTKDKMEEEIERCQNGEIEPIDVFYSVQLTAGHLMKVLSTLIGELDGIKVIPEIEQKIDLLINQYYFGKLWREFKQALRTLDSTYPNWNSLIEINPLKEVVLKVWNCLGVYPVDKIDGLHILLNKDD